MQTIRQKKISRQLQKDLAEIINTEGRTLFGTTLLSITIVRVSADLSIARVYISVFGNQKKEDFLSQVNLKRGLIRKKLGIRVRNQMRKVPELKFFLDDSVDYADNIQQLLK